MKTEREQRRANAREFLNYLEQHDPSTGVRTALADWKEAEDALFDLAWREVYAPPPGVRKRTAVELAAEYTGCTVDEVMARIYEAGGGRPTTAHEKAVLSED